MDEVKIKVTIGSKTLELTFPEDLDIWEWADKLKTILSFATFHPNTIREILRGLDEEFTVEDENDEKE